MIPPRCCCYDKLPHAPFGMHLHPASFLVALRLERIARPLMLQLRRMQLAVDKRLTIGVTVEEAARYLSRITGAHVEQKIATTITMRDLLYRSKVY